MSTKQQHPALPTYVVCLALCFFITPGALSELAPFLDWLAVLAMGLATGNLVNLSRINCIPMRNFLYSFAAYFTGFAYVATEAHYVNVGQGYSAGMDYIPVSMLGPVSILFFVIVIALSIKPMIGVFQFELARNAVLKG